MKKVRMIVEMDEKAYKALIGQEVFNIWKGNTILSTIFNAIKNAIPLTKCDDCVSRQAVLKELRSCLTGGEIEYRYVKLHIDSIPPVLPKREQGEWCEQNDDYFDWYECSECGYGSEGEMQYSSEHDVRTKYCPNCGAEMR